MYYNVVLFFTAISIHNIFKVLFFVAKIPIVARRPGRATSSASFRITLQVEDKPLLYESFVEDLFPAWRMIRRLAKLVDPGDDKPQSV